MIVQDKNGAFHSAYEVKLGGPNWCSMCGRAMVVGEGYTMRKIFHPYTKQIAYAVQCVDCFPYEPIQQTTGAITPVRESTTDRREVVHRWTREAPQHVDEVLTQVLDVPPTGMNKILRKVHLV